MRAGEFPDGAHVLRAKIDMASPNINMRDPTLYRIRHAAHHRTGDAWSHLPDLRLRASDCRTRIEGITHSLCTLEFEDHRPLYDWVCRRAERNGAEFKSRPRQIEFARLNLNYTIMSKRKLLALVQQQLVRGWDDPRMPTIAGIRRRGYTPEAVRDFCARIGVAKKENVIDIALLEHTVREDLNRHARARARGPAAAAGRHRELSGGTRRRGRRGQQPGRFSAGTRRVPFSRVLLHRAGRLHGDAAEEVLQAVAWQRSAAALRVHLEVRSRSSRTRQAPSSSCDARYDPESLTGSTAARRVKGTIHWVSAEHACDAEVRLYDRLFLSEDPGDERARSARRSELRIRWSASPARRSNRRWRQRPPARAFNSNGRGISASIPIHGRASRCSTERSPLKDSWARIQKRA